MTSGRVRRNGIAPYITAVGFAVVMPEAQKTARPGGAAGTAAASLMLKCCVRDGNLQGRDSLLALCEA